MHLKNLPHIHSFVVPQNWSSLPASTLLANTGLVRFVDAGLPYISPVLQRIVCNIEGLIRKNAERYGFNEMRLPTVMKRESVERTGVYEHFASEFFQLQGAHDGYILTGTSEESFLSYIGKGGLVSHRQLPMKICAFQDAFRNIKRPEGIYKSREFFGCIMASLDEDNAGFKKSLGKFRTLCGDVYASIGLNPIEVLSSDSSSVEYLFPSREGDRPMTKSVAFDESKCSNLTSGLFGSLAMGYLTNKPQDLGVMFADSSNALKIPAMGTYGVGTQRCICAIFENLRDSLGIKMTKAVRPFDVSIINLSNDSGEYCDKIHDSLVDLGVRTMIDDRQGIQLSKSLSISDFLGVPVRIVIGNKERKLGNVEIRLRADSQSRVVIPENQLLAYAKQNIDCT